MSMEHDTESNRPEMTMGIGDEPLMEPEVMEKAILPFFDNPELQVSNLMTKINDPVDVVNFTVPKVITNKEGIGIYLTRSTAPYPKGSIDYAYWIIYY